MRAATYARFSTDLQSERSIEDQIALCRAFADRQGMTVVATYSDRAKSGASIFGRDGLMEMMVAARGRAFDVLLVEHTDRIARSMRDLADIHEKLAFFGIDIRAVHSGAVLDTAMVGLFGLVGQMQREDGSKKVRRGMAGVIRDGRHAGGRAYGYRPLQGSPGHLEIVEDEASVVRRIFADYLAGLTPRTIAYALNAERVTPPRGRAWNASTINGNAARGNGILNNEIYAGRIVWNKVRMVKNPETGRRVSRVNAAAERQTTAAPHLSIVTDEVFAAVQARKAGRAELPKGIQRAPRRLLSGLLRCGACGAGMAIKDRDKTGKTRIWCSAAAESGICGHGRSYYAEAVEELTVAGLREELRDPQAIEEYVRTYHARRRERASGTVAERARLGARIGEIAREMERLIDAIASGAAPAAVIGPRIKALEAEQREVTDALAALEDDVQIIALHPTAIDRYLSQIDHLALELAKGSSVASGSAASAFRELVERVIVYPVPPKSPLQIEVRGYLAELTRDPGMRPNYSRTASGDVVVAEDRYIQKPRRSLEGTFSIFPIASPPPFTGRAG